VSEVSAPSPAVSVIVPTFDRLPLLRETIASVLDQTYGDLELIAADDGSTDGTAAYVEGIDDRRVRLVALTHGGNVSRALNAGAAAGSASSARTTSGSRRSSSVRCARRRRQGRGGATRATS
jgi:GT2 family glycosyltransferase